MTDSEDNRFYIALGARIRDARIGANLTQDGLGQVLSLSRSSIANIEKGRQHPQIHTLCNIAKILRIDVEKLLPSTTLPRIVNPELTKLIAQNHNENTQEKETLIGLLQQISIQKLSKDE